jgi:hypothetical protein
MGNSILKRGILPLFFSLLLQHLIFNCSAQRIKKLTKEVDMIFAKKHVGFTIIPLFTNKANITRNMDKYWIHSTPLAGFEAGFNKYSHFDKKHSVMVGIFFGAFARNLNYAIPGNEFSPPADGYVTTNGAASREFNFTGSIPILLEKRWFKKNNNFWNADIGFTIRYTPREYFIEDDIWNWNYIFYHLDFIVNPHKTLWLNYNIGGGYSWILKNENIFKTNLIANISVTSFAKGSYQFTLPNRPIVKGNYEVKGSYVGLSFSYVLTKANKLSRKINQYH